MLKSRHLKVKGKSLVSSRLKPWKCVRDNQEATACLVGQRGLPLQLQLERKQQMAEKVVSMMCVGHMCIVVRNRVCLPGCMCDEACDGQTIALK